MKPDAAIGKNDTTGIPSSSAALMEKLMKPSATMQVTGLVLVLSFAKRLRNEFMKNPLLMDIVIAVRSWVESGSELVGKPSGMASKRNSGKPSSESGPKDLRKRLWLYSVVLWWRSLANLRSGFMWPWYGNGIHTA